MCIHAGLGRELPARPLFLPSARIYKAHRVSDDQWDFPEVLVGADFGNLIRRAKGAMKFPH